MEWTEATQRSPLKLYAGDIVDQSKYPDIIGLSLLYSNQNHILHDITEMFPIQNECVDFFQSEDVFEHIQYEKLDKVIEEIYRILKKGSIFRLSVPDYGCDVLYDRCVKNEQGEILFDPGGGGTIENPAHLWFPRIDRVQELLDNSSFAEKGEIDYLHYYNMNSGYVLKPIDYSIGFILRTPDHDKRVQNPIRPMSLVVDLIKTNE
ncbi:MAG: methyltransferase domain-containing protein [Calditrichaeota bacterium]|nr:methyltransferase domain-containing protein [Calditrichota bacterium]